MSKKLLVVEDSKAIVSIIKKIGESLGYEVTTAVSHAEVKKLLQSKTQYFAATIDYALPDAENGEAIESVLSHGIPGVVMTGRMDDETRQKILAQPVIDYIPKENSQAFMYLKRILYWQSANIGIGVLVVDDSLTARNHIHELLKRRNFTVYVAEGGEQALEILKNHHDIKMVITDLVMPGMDGIELTNEIRKLYNRDQISVIGISGADNVNYSARIIKNGADDFIRKPFCPEEFYCRITQHIENIHNIERIRKAANTDYLTDLPNRRAFFKEARSALESYAQQKTAYGLAMLDIDWFKKVNDNYGHEAGDQMLKMLAREMRNHFHQSSLARFGGEEFVILLSGSDQAQIYTLLDAFRQDIANTEFSHEDHQINFTVSIGVIFNSVLSLEDQLNQADVALYNAKENGRNQIVISA